jgi:hypothetical protein
LGFGRGRWSPRAVNAPSAAKPDQLAVPRLYTNALFAWNVALYGRLG